MSGAGGVTVPVPVAFLSYARSDRNYAVALR